MEAKNRDVGLIYAFGAILLLLTGWVYWDYYGPEWKSYQSEFRGLVTGHFGAERARQVPSGIQQIWVAELNRVDRCVTCHLGLEWEGLEDVPNPYRAHPPGILKKHPLASYGCTICHGGQGYSTEFETAHAITAQHWQDPLQYTELHWEEPLLAGEIGRANQVQEPKALLQINCNICHRYDAQTEGADYINYAKQIVQEKRCVICHKINGQGALLGPDLSYVGDQSPEHYDYSRLPGRPSVLAWHIGHFKNPKDVAPQSIMPNFNFGPRETQALAMLTMSWKRTSLPSSYIPPPKAAPPPPTEAAPAQR